MADGQENTAVIPEVDRDASSDAADLGTQDDSWSPFITGAEPRSYVELPLAERVRGLEDQVHELSQDVRDLESRVGVVEQKVASAAVPNTGVSPVEVAKPVVKKEPLPVDPKVQLLQGLLKTWAGNGASSEGNPSVDPGQVDGVMGGKTRAAMERYARSVNLPENSSVDDLIANFKNRVETDPDFKMRLKNNMQYAVYNSTQAGVTKDLIKGIQVTLNFLDQKDDSGRSLKVDGIAKTLTTQSFDRFKNSVEQAATKPKAEAGELKQEFTDKAAAAQAALDAGAKNDPVYPAKANHSSHQFPDDLDSRGFAPMDENYIANTDIKWAKVDEPNYMSDTNDKALGVITVEPLGKINLTREVGGDVVAHNITKEVTRPEGYAGVSTIPVAGSVRVQMANGLEFSENKAHASGKEFDDQVGILKSVKAGDGQEYKLWATRSTTPAFSIDGKDVFGTRVVVVTPEFEALNRDLLARAAAQTPPELANNTMGLSNMRSTYAIQNTISGEEKPVTAESVAADRAAELREWQSKIGPHGRL